MARNMSGMKIKGSVGGLNFYGDNLIRSERKGIDKKVFATKPSLKGMYDKSQEFKLVAKGTKLLKDAVRPLFVHARDGSLHNRISSILNIVKNNDEVATAGSMTINNGFKNPLGRHLFKEFKFTPERSVSDTLSAAGIYNTEQHSYTVSGFDTGNIVFPGGATHMEVGLSMLRVDFDRNTHTALSGPGIFIDKRFERDSFTLRMDGLPKGKGILITLAYVRFYLELEGRKYIVKNELGVDVLGIEIDTIKV